MAVKLSGLAFANRNKQEKENLNRERGIKALTPIEQEQVGRLNMKRKAIQISYKELDLKDLTFQIRKAANKQKEEISKDIDANGQQTPILVRPKGEKYQIISGFTRSEILAELKKPIEAFVYTDIDDDDCLLLAVGENVKRENLRFKDIYDLIDGERKKGKSIQQIATTLGKRERTIHYYQKIAENPEITEMLKKDKITLTYAIELLDQSKEDITKLSADLKKEEKANKADSTEKSAPIGKPKAKVKAVSIDKKTGKVKISITGTLEDSGKIIDELKEAIESIKKAGAK